MLCEFSGYRFMKNRSYLHMHLASFHSSKLQHCCEYKLFIRRASYGHWVENSYTNNYYGHILKIVIVYVHKDYCYNTINKFRHMCNIHQLIHNYIIIGFANVIVLLDCKIVPCKLYQILFTVNMSIEFTIITSWNRILHNRLCKLEDFMFTRKFYQRRDVCCNTHMYTNKEN